MPHRVSSAPARRPGRPRQDGPPCGTGCAGSGGGERVVAGPGQDVAGLAEDLAGLGDGGALAVAAVLDLRVVVVVGGRGAGVGLAGLIDRPAQRLRALAGQPPGDRFESEEYTVTSSPANRTASREEENRPAPAGSSTRAAGPRPAAPAGTVSRSWRAACGRGR